MQVGIRDAEYPELDLKRLPMILWLGSWYGKHRDKMVASVHLPITGRF
ncbi:hypothetical protein [Paenibacillus sp. Leaf72]|nr:hypothetical protein [Paenibacillus sp. Leaf72]